MKVGILALQGDVREHTAACRAAGFDVLEVRSILDLQKADALILPGGESTVLFKFLSETGLHQAMIERGKNGLPIFGTCAGAILLSTKIIQEASSVTVEPLGLLDCTIERNAYGRQNESFEADLVVKWRSQKDSVHGIFIRAPKIVSVAPNVEILSEYAGSPVLVRQGNIIAATFHPELLEATDFYRHVFV